MSVKIVSPENLRRRKIRAHSVLFKIYKLWIRVCLVHIFFASLLTLFFPAFCRSFEQSCTFTPSGIYSVNLASNNCLLEVLLIWFYLFNELHTRKNELPTLIMWLSLIRMFIQCLATKNTLISSNKSIQFNILVLDAINCINTIPLA